MTNVTVLLVEDDAAVRRMMAVLLRHYGYSLIEAGDGNEALMLAGADVVIDLVVTDLHMPVLDGRALLQRLMLKRPSPHVLVCSGGARVPNLTYLPKPFTPQQFRAALEAAMQSPTLADAAPDLSAEGLESVSRETLFKG